jgi:RNA 3'-terminal phosphate cyclase (ATP)
MHINKQRNSGTRPTIIETPSSILNLEQSKSYGSGGKDKGRRDKNHSNRKQDRDQPSQMQPRDRNTVHLDGSTLEGGGQLVRVALTLSAITKIPIHITRIRAGRGEGRNSGGLKESHLAALEVLGEECCAQVQGSHVGSKELLFEPAKRAPRQDRQSSETRRRTIELQKPGSVWLILQALLPWYLLQPGRTELTLKGGTNVSSSMSGDYVQQVLVPVLEKLISSTIQVDIIRRGWAGNAPQIGEVKVSIEGHTPDSDADTVKTWDGFTVQTRGTISKIALTLIAQPASLRAALLSRASEEISLKFPTVNMEITTNEDSLDPRRLYILLVAHTTSGWRLGRDFLGTGKKLNSQREVDGLVEGGVKGVVEGLRKEVERGGCVDEFLQDQLVVFQALAAGRSAVDAGKGEGTLHARTVRWVCGEVLGGGGFAIEEGGGCGGIGSRIGMGDLA